MITYGKSSLTEGEAQDAGELLALLGDPTRRAIIESLRASPKPVVEIAADLPVSRPAVSQHLKLLKEAGLVSDQAHGNRRIYSLDPTSLAPLMAYLDGFWRIALANYATAAAKAARSQRPARRRRG